MPLYAYFSAALLGMLGQETPKGKNTFISFNYDTLLEDGLHAIGVKFSYGFQLGTARYDSRYPGSIHDEEVRVLKLHGSVNWSSIDSDPEEITIYRNYSDARIASDGEERFAPEVVPPTWNKQVGGHLSDVWSEAVAQLATATNIVIIGFSIPPTDMHFKYLLAASLKENISLRRVVFVNPNLGSVRERAMQIFNPQHLASEFIDFVSAPSSEFEGMGMGVLSFLTSWQQVDPIQRPFGVGPGIKTGETRVF